MFNLWKLFGLDNQREITYVSPTPTSEAVQELDLPDLTAHTEAIEKLRTKIAQQSKDIKEKAISSANLIRTLTIPNVNSSAFASSYRFFIANLPCGAISYSDDFTILCINQAAEKLFDAHSSRVVGTSFKDLLDANDLHLFDEKALHSTSTVDLVSDNKLIKMAVTEFPTTGESSVFIATFEDKGESIHIKSSMHKLNSKLTTLEAMFDSLPESIVVVDMHKDQTPVVYMNKAAEAIYAVDRSQVIGKSPDSLKLIDGDLEASMNIRSAISRSISFTHELTVGDITYQYSVYPLKEANKGKSFYWVHKVVNVTCCKFTSRVKQHLASLVSDSPYILSIYDAKGEVLFSSKRAEELNMLKVGSCVYDSQLVKFPRLTDLEQKTVDPVCSVHVSGTFITLKFVPTEEAVIVFGLPHVANTDPKISVQAISDHLPLPVYIKEVGTNKILYANSLMTAYTGYPIDELLSKTVFEMTDPIQHPGIIKKDQEILRSCGPQLVRSRFKCNGKEDGGHLLLRSIYYDSHGKAVGIIGIVLDIGSMFNHTLNDKNLIDVVGTNREPVAILDNALQIVYRNDAFTAHFGAAAGLGDLIQGATLVEIERGLKEEQVSSFDHVSSFNKKLGFHSVLVSLSSNMRLYPQQVNGNNGYYMFVAVVNELA